MNSCLLVFGILLCKLLQAMQRPGSVPNGNGKDQVHLQDDFYCPTKSPKTHKAYDITNRLVILLHFLCYLIKPLS